MRVAAFAVTMCLAVSASAQNKEEEKAKKEAKRLLFQGDAAFAKKDYKGALLKYQQAYDAFQSPKIFYPMAQTYEKLGLELEAILHYERLLDEAGSDISAELRGEAKVRINQIEQRLALVRFDVKPEGTHVVVDEIEVGEVPLSRPVRVKPGAHSYKLWLDGYKAVEGTLELKAGSREQVSRELKAIGGKKPPPVVKKPPKTPKTPPKTATTSTTPTTTPVTTTETGTGTGSGTVPEGRTGSGKPVLIASIVATSVLGATTCVTGILAVQKHGIYTDEMRTLAQREKARDSGKTLALVTDLALVGTVAAAAFTTYWYFYVVKPESEWAAGANMATTTTVAPYVSGEGGGLMVEGRF
jgi:hypothetical protein